MDLPQVTFELGRAGWRVGDDEVVAVEILIEREEFDDAAGGVRGFGVAVEAEGIARAFDIDRAVFDGDGYMLAVAGLGYCPLAVRSSVIVPMFAVAAERL